MRIKLKTYTNDAIEDCHTDMIKNNSGATIDIVKLLLIFGVVSIHSNVLVDSPDLSPSVGSDVVVFLSSTLTAICVPCFFIISGYLFFFNQNSFTTKDYADKIRRRLRTLLIPYILWNLISLVLQLLKIHYLGFPAHGLIANGSICWGKLFEGFYDYVDGYPFAFAFWFIRNLMIFVILSPVAFILRGKYAGPIFTIVCCLLNTTLWGFSFFVIGSIIAKSFKKAIFKMPTWASMLCGFLWIGISIIDVRVDFNYLSSTVLFVESISALIFIISIVQYLESKEKILLRNVVVATFFIYAFHQLFCTVVRNFYIGIFGLNTSLGIISSFFCTLITLTVVSYIVWMVFNRISPPLVRILCGSRGTPVRRPV